MRQYQITGMSCAACSARVEKAVSKVPGVDSCAVSLLTNSMGIEGSAKDDDIIKAVVAAGYGAEAMNGHSAANDESLLEDKETPKLKKRLIASLIFLAVLMYISMGHHMLGLPLPDALMTPEFMGGSQLVLTVIIMIINCKFFISGIGSVFHGAPNMDTLVALGAGAAFGYSIYQLIIGDVHGLYFESAAMILTLITVGKMLEARSKGRTTDALRSLMNMAPKTATLIRDEAEVVVPVEEVMIGDYFAVRPGESIPVDGIVDEGISAVDEAALTGESIPVDKAAGDVVSAGTINKSGYLVCIATRVGENTAISQIIKMVSDAAATKAPIAKVADKVAGIFVPVVIGIALVVFGIWMACGGGVETALTRAIAVLVISCPCALGLATPVAIMVGNGMGAKKGILFKTAVSLEETGKVATVVIDKTGTATKGEPVVTDIIPSFGIKEYDLLQVAYSLETLSEHPLAKAVVEYATANHVRTKRVDKFGVLPGNGLMGFIGDEPVCGGNLAYIETQVDVEDEIRNKAEELARDGKTPLFFANETSVIGIIAVADQVKEESDEAIVQLKNMGIKVVMLTGDNALTAAAVGRQLGVDTVYAGVLPDGKENIIRQLSQTGKVAMVGDGINDAPALTRADIGIAIGAGTDVAIDAADIVLMNSNLVDVPAAIRLSRATLKTIHQNLFWAFGYNVICIPIAAGALIPICGLGLSPMIAAACMSLSSFCVVTNALRLNIYDMMDSSKDSAAEGAATSENEFQVIDLTETNITKKENTMNKTMKIEGMMCMHCEARVKQTLEGLAQVDEAAVSHEANNAVLTLNADISNEELKAAVEAQGYQVVGIE